MITTGLTDSQTDKLNNHGFGRAYLNLLKKFDSRAINSGFLITTRQLFSAIASIILDLYDTIHTLRQRLEVAKQKRAEAVMRVVELERTLQHLQHPIKLLSLHPDLYAEFFEHHSSPPTPQETAPDYSWLVYAVCRHLLSKSTDDLKNLGFTSPTARLEQPHVCLLANNIVHYVQHTSIPPHSFLNVYTPTYWTANWFTDLCTGQWRPKCLEAYKLHLEDPELPYLLHIAYQVSQFKKNEHDTPADLRTTQG